MIDIKSLQIAYDYLAPDTSEIRMLAELNAAGLCHCTLPIGKASSAVKHKTVVEIWYCLSGSGEIWQSNATKSDTKIFKAGDSFTIPAETSFQFRNTGSEILQILIVTIPKWPGPHEAIPAIGKWHE